MPRQVGSCKDFLVENPRWAVGGAVGSVAVLALGYKVYNWTTPATSKAIEAQGSQATIDSLGAEVASHPTVPVRRPSARARDLYSQSLLDAEQTAQDYIERLSSMAERLRADTEISADLKVEYLRRFEVILQVYGSVLPDLYDRVISPIQISTVPTDYDDPLEPAHSVRGAASLSHDHNGALPKVHHPHVLHVEVESAAGRSPNGESSSSSPRDSPTPSPLASTTPLSTRCPNMKDSPTTQSARGSPTTATPDDSIRALLKSSVVRKAPRSLLSDDEDSFLSAADDVDWANRLDEFSDELPLHLAESEPTQPIPLLLPANGAMSESSSLLPSSRKCSHGSSTSNLSSKSDCEDDSPPASISKGGAIWDHPKTTHPSAKSDRQTVNVSLNTKALVPDTQVALPIVDGLVQMAASSIAAPLLATPTSIETLLEKGFRMAQNNLVPIRNTRSLMVGLREDKEFTAKVYCLRLAFKECFNTEEPCLFMGNELKSILSEVIAKNSPEQSVNFGNAFDTLAAYMRRAENQASIQTELAQRKVPVVDFGPFDVVLEWGLMDALADLDAPPEIIRSVLANQWWPASLKRNSLKACVKSVIYTKRQMLSSNDCFMSRFYDLTDASTPILCVEYMIPSENGHKQVVAFKNISSKMLKALFCHAVCDYTSVDSLAATVLKTMKDHVNEMRRQL